MEVSRRRQSVPGSGPTRLHDGGEIGLAESLAPPSPRAYPPACAAAPNGHAEGLAHLQTEPHVLEHVLGLEQRRVVVLTHRAGLQREHRRAARAGPDDLDERVEVHARRVGEHQRLGDRRGVGGGERVVDHLDRLALPELADVHDRACPSPRAADGRASTSCAAPPAMIVSVASSARGEDPVTGASTSATPRWPSAVRRSRRVSAGAIVEHVDAQQARRAAPSTTPPRAEQDRLDLSAVDDHADHDVARAGDRGRRVGHRGAVLAGPALGLARRVRSTPSADSRRARRWRPSASP